LHEALDAGEDLAVLPEELVRDRLDLERFVVAALNLAF
jgi:hypothetical protein